MIVVNVAIFVLFFRLLVPLLDLIIDSTGTGCELYLCLYFCQVLLVVCMACLFIFFLTGGEIFALPTTELFRSLAGSEFRELDFDYTHNVFDLL